MDILINKRPFFSVIIPTYNPKDGLKALLQSLQNQYLNKEDLQIIISDDCSTINYQDTVDQFENTLNIKQVKTDYNCCPGNTRQRGVQYATGEWITFIDQDDIFKNNVFKNIQKAISLYPEIIFIETGINYVDITTGQQLTFNPPVLGCLHGKFFNLDKFWKKYNLYFPKDLISHEDIAITTQLWVLKHQYQEQLKEKTGCVYYTVYQWHKSPDTLSNKKYFYKEEKIPRQFSDMFFNNYVKATLQLLLQACKDKKYDQKSGFLICCYDLYLIYQRSERDRYINPNPIIENYECLYSIFIQMLKFFNKTPNDIIFILQQNNQDKNTITNYALSTSTSFLYKHSFSQWVNLLYTQKLFKEIS